MKPLQLQAELEKHKKMMAKNENSKAKHDGLPGSKLGPSDLRCQRSDTANSSNQAVREVCCCCKRDKLGGIDLSKVVKCRYRAKAGTSPLLQAEQE